MAKKTQKKSEKKNKAKKFKMSVPMLVLLLLLVVGGLLYLPMAIFFIASMMPTFVAYMTDNQVGKNKTFTIGALNFSAFFYYLINIVQQPLPLEATMDFLADPMTIIVMYSAAALGYMLNYICTLMVSSILQQKSHDRIKKLEKKKKKLEERWGTKVNGERTLDKLGFIKAHQNTEE